MYINLYYLYTYDVYIIICIKYYKILWSYAIARPGGPVGRALTRPEAAAAARRERNHSDPKTKK